MVILLLLLFLLFGGGHDEGSRAMAVASVGGALQGYLTNERNIRNFNVVQTLNHFESKCKSVLLSRALADF